MVRTSLQQQGTRPLFYTKDTNKMCIFLHWFLNETAIIYLVNNYNEPSLSLEKLSHCRRELYRLAWFAKDGDTTVLGWWASCGGPPPTVRATPPTILLWVGPQIRVEPIRPYTCVSEKDGASVFCFFTTIAGDSCQLAADPAHHSPQQSVYTHPSTHTHVPTKRPLQGQKQHPACPGQVRLRRK